ncbi:MAG: sigma-70 family RNA polymerase sigma factor [Planctomycetes bacterium]|nr:sigma-70 family RNA polymerase sigma factor [Planctomycetota bacterium]
MSDAAAPNVEALLEHARWARALARELVGGDVHQADDLTQEAFAAALVRPPSDQERTSGWLARVLRNRRVSNLRREDARGRAEPRAARAEAQPSTLELVEQAETQRRLVACVLALEEPYRRVVLLRWFGDLPPREIARAENVPLATVTSRLTRAHAKLREKLEREYGERRAWVRALAPLALAGERFAPPTPDARLSDPSAGSPLGAGLAVGALVLALGGAWVAWQALRSAQPSDSTLDARADGPAVELAPTTTSSVVESSRSAQESPDASAVAPSADLRLRGQVLLPDGRPAAGARVGTGKLEAFGAKSPPAGFRSVLCDADGRFEFEPPFARRVELTALHSDAAPSATLSADPAALARAPSAPLVLQLRSGARVVGVVFGPDGKPAPARELQMQSDFGAGRRTTASDQGGAFDFASLAPGRWTILSFPGEEEARLHGLGEPNSVKVFEHLAQRVLALDDGQVVHLELGRAPMQSILVEGRVTFAGAGQSALLQFVGPGERALELQRIARTDADGRYRVALAEPGAYLVKLTAMDEPGTHVIERVYEAPRAAADQLDFALPAGAIRGRVVDALGAPVPGASVRLRREVGGARSLLTSFSDAKSTDADGAFAFERLDDGGWSLSVYAQPESDKARALGRSAEENTAEQGDDAKTAASVSAVLDVRDGRSVDGVVIQIAAGTLLRGFLRDGDGAPAPLASLFVHSGTRLLTPFAWSASDADGAFEGPALAPGEYFVHARSGALCSALQRVLVERGEAPALELTLAPGGFVELSFSSAAAAQSATLSLRDEQGREFVGCVERALKSLDVLTSFRPGAVRLGPLPPALYRLTVVDTAGLVQNFDVAVAAGETRSVSVR